jgi:hypothetical protein
MNPPNIPIFENWTHEYLAKFATEAYIKMQDQKALIQQLRQLIASAPETEPECPEAAWKRAVSEMRGYLNSAHTSGIDDWYLTLDEELTQMEDRYEAPTRKTD